MAKKIGGEKFNEPKKENKPKKSQKGKTVYNVPEVKKRKKKRSEKLRISLCILFLFGIISVSFPFTKFNVERTFDTEKDVADEIGKVYNVKIDKKKITLKTPIKELGSYSADVKLYEGIIAQVKISVVGL